MRPTTRRSTVLLAAGLILASAFASACGPAPEGDGAPAEDPQQLVVASFGGAWQEAQRRAMFEPFEAESGIEVTDVEYDGAYSAIREKGGAGEWDVVDVEPAELLRGAAEGIYEPIDYSGIDREALLESALHPYGVGLMTYAVVLGYDAAAFSDAASAPATWADFFDLERFPGRRALRSTPEWMLEIALLADGVPRDELYPLDLDRAFRSLARIEDAVVVFEEWSEPGELLAAGEAALAVGTNGRLSEARQAGGEIGMSWHGGLVASDYFVIPTGSGNRAAAQELVRYAVGREAQSAFPRHIDYGPVHRQALDALPEELRERLPSDPDHLAEAVPFDAGWWLEHEDEAHRRYEAWLEDLPAPAAPGDRE